MNTIQVGNVTSQVDISKYVKEAVPEQISQDKQTKEIEQEIPAKGTKQYDELKASLINAKMPVTEENIKTADLMIKSGIEVQKENMEAAIDIKKQVEYIINHINNESVNTILNNNLSLDKITIDILENIIRDVNNKGDKIEKNDVSKQEVKEATDKYIEENKLKDKLDKQQTQILSKCIGKLIEEKLPITNKNVQMLVSVISKTEEIKTIDENISIDLIKKDKEFTIENIYISKYSSNKSNGKSLKQVSDKDWKMLLPQIEKLIEKENIEDKKEALKVAKLLLDNEIPVTKENISKIINAKDFNSKDIDIDKLLDEAVKNIKSDRPVTDINLDKETNNISKKEDIIEKSNLKSVKNQVPLKQTNQKSINKSSVKNLENEINQQRQNKILENITEYDEEIIENALANGNGELTLKDLQTSYEHITDKDIMSKSEQKDILKTDIQKELKIVTAKRQLAEIRLRLTSEAMTTLIQKGIEIDTMPLKDVIKELKTIENDLYKSQLNMTGAEANEENVSQMRDLYDKLASITDLSTPTYKEIIYKEIPFNVDGLSDAEKINSNTEQLQLQEASKVYENLQTQPNPKFKESFSKISQQIEPLLEDLDIESTKENIRATEILVKNKMEVNKENISDIKLIDSKVTKVTTQLHPSIVADMIKNGLKPSQMHVDEVIGYMNKFKDLLGEDLTEKISSYIYDMDKSGEMTEPERETMIGIYRMLYTIQKTQGRATGFVIKNDMPLTLNNLMEASKYYDRTNAKYSDIDVKVNDKFGTLEKLIVSDKSIKSQLDKAYQDVETSRQTKPDPNYSYNLNQKSILHDVEKEINENNSTRYDETETLYSTSNTKSNSFKPQNKDLENNILSNTEDKISDLKQKTKDVIVENKNFYENDNFDENSNNKIVSNNDEFFNKVNSNIKSNNIDNNLKQDIKINEDVKYNQSIIKELIEVTDVKDMLKLVKEVPNIENIPLEEVVDMVKQLKKLDVKHIKPLQNNDMKKDIKDEIPKNMDINEVKKYIKDLKILSQDNKDTVIKIYDTFRHLQNQNSEVINNIIRKDTQLTIKDLEKSVETRNGINESVRSNNDITIKNNKSNIEIQNNTIKNNLNEFIQNIKPDIVTKIVKNDVSIENMTVKEITENIQKYSNTNIENKNLESLFKMNINKVLNYINENKSLSQKDKTEILKIHNLIETFKNSEEKLNKLSISDNLTLKDIIKNSKSYDTYNLKDEKYKDLSEFIKKSDIHVIDKIIDKYSNIDNIPIKKVLEYINETEKFKSIKDFSNVQIKFNSENIKKEYLNEMKIDKVLEYIDNTKNINQENKETILKIHNLLESIKQTKNASINEIYQNTKQDINQITLNDLIECSNKFKDIKIKDAELLIDEVVLESQSEQSKTYKNEINTTQFNTEKLSNQITKDTHQYSQNSNRQQIKDEEYASGKTELNSKFKNFEVTTQNKKNIKYQTNQEQDIQIMDSQKISDINNKDIISSFIHKASPEVLSKLIVEYKDITSMNIENVLNIINKLSQQNNSFSGLTDNIQSNFNDITKVIDETKKLTVEDKNKLTKIFDTINKIKTTDFKSVNSILQSNLPFTIDNLISSTNSFNNTHYISPYNEINDSDVKNQSLQYTASEYEEQLFVKFIQKAQPEIIAKVIKQYPDIQNIPIENILKCMEDIKKETNYLGYNKNDNNQQKVEEFIKNLNEIKNVEPTTMLWMQKYNIPLTVSNIQTIQSFIKNPFAFGKEIKDFSKEVKEKLGEKNLLSKSIVKKDLLELKNGKQVEEILDELYDEIEKVKKEAIKLPQNERQNLWKQSDNLEKAIEMQKQIQKDEYLYQIPMNLHNGLTNMNLYVMNDRQGDGKLSENDMKVFISLDTETMGTVQVYMKLSEKSVSFQINTENPVATKFLRSKQSVLQKSIEDLGYMISNMQYGEEEKKSPIKLQMQPQINLAGKNISKNNGFETII